MTAERWRRHRLTRGPVERRPLAVVLAVVLILAAVLAQARGAGVGWRLVAEAAWSVKDADECARKRAQAYRILKTTGATSMRVKCLMS